MVEMVQYVQLMIINWSNTHTYALISGSIFVSCALRNAKTNLSDSHFRQIFSSSASWAHLSHYHHCIT
jgi:hypothetical protein